LKKASGRYQQLVYYLLFNVPAKPSNLLIAEPRHYKSPFFPVV